MKPAALATIVLSFVLSLSTARAATLLRKDVADPSVILPDEGSIWRIGSKQTVVWDTSNLPVNITNPIGRVILGFLPLNDTSGGLNLMLDNPLAEGFNITKGFISVTVPDVSLRDDYIVVLMGSSSNASPRFSIKAASGTPTDTSSGGSQSSSTANSTPSQNTASSPSVVYMSCTMMTSPLFGTPSSTSSGILSASTGSSATTVTGARSVASSQGENSSATMPKALAGASTFVVTLSVLLATIL